MSDNIDFVIDAAYRVSLLLHERKAFRGSELITIQLDDRTMSAPAESVPPVDPMVSEFMDEVRRIIWTSTPTTYKPGASSALDLELAVQASDQLLEDKVRSIGAYTFDLVQGHLGASAGAGRSLLKDLRSAYSDDRIRAGNRHGFDIS